LSAGSAIDILGLLLGVMITSADVGDRAAAQILLHQVTDVHHRLALVWADGGYTGSLVEYCLAAFALVLAIVKRSDDMRGFVVLPRRWIVERFFAQLMRNRRLVRDFERRTTSAEAMIYWSMTLLMARCLAPLTPRASVNRTRAGSASQPRVTKRSPSTSGSPLAPEPRPCRRRRPSPGRYRPLPEPAPVRKRGEDALRVHRQRRPRKPFTPHRHLRLRLRRFRR
jgi:transposase